MKGKTILNTLMILAVVSALFTITVAVAADPPAPGFSYSVDDCDGEDNQFYGPAAGYQQVPPNPQRLCHSYNADLYENVEYNWPASGKPPGCTDIDSFHVGWGSDAGVDYLYFEWTLSGTYISGDCDGIKTVLEIDTDKTDNEGSPAAPRGDYYIGTELNENCDTTSWYDAKNAGGWTGYYDPDAGVGGAHPQTGDPTCADCPDAAGVTGGYSDALAGSADEGKVWCRMVDSTFAPGQTGFQLAVKRDLLPDFPTGEPTNARFRAWTSQSSSLSNDKLYWHDENPSDKLAAGDTDIDNTEWGGFPECGSSGADSLVYDGTNVQWDINNSGYNALAIQSLEDLQWPVENGNLTGVSLGGNAIWSGNQPHGAAFTISTGWTGTLGDRTIEAGNVETLELTFQNNARTNPSNTDPYYLLARFDSPLGCVVDISAGGATAVTLSSFAVNSSAGGSVNPLWLGLAGLTVLAAGSLFWAKRQTG